MEPSRPLTHDHLAPEGIPLPSDGTATKSTDSDGVAWSGSGNKLVTPELALVDPELARNERQFSDRKAAMSSISPSNDTFFIDPPEFAPPKSSAAPEPVVEPAEAPVPAPAESVPPPPAPTPAPAREPAPEPAPAAAAVESSSTKMRDVLLGTLIVRAGLLEEEQLEDALQEGMRTGKRLGEVLLRRGWLHERDLARLLAGQKGLPFVEVRASDAQPAALQMLPEEKARLQLVLPLRHHEGQLVVAVADPSNELALENLRRTLGSEPRLVVAPRSELIHAIAEAYARLGASAPEPSQQPSLEQPGPALADETSSQPRPAVRPEPTDGPVQPVAAPVVAALATLRPAESNDAPPEAAPPQPDPAAEAEEQPRPAEAMAPSVPTADETPAPRPEESGPQPEPAVAPDPATPPVPAAVANEPAPAEKPLPAAAPQLPAAAVEAQPVRVLELPKQALLSPPVAVPESDPAPSEQAAPEPPSATPVVSEKPSPRPSSSHVVLLRLRGGEALEVGTFPTGAEASARAQEVVRQITTAEGEAAWPFFAERYLRPATIVSVDLLEEPASKGLAAESRHRWAAHPRRRRP